MQYQQESPIWGVWGERLYLMKTAQSQYSSAGPRQGSLDTDLGVNCSGVNSSARVAALVNVVAPAREPQSLMENEWMPHQDRVEAGLFREEPLPHCPPSPTIGSFSCKWGLQMVTVWVIQKALSWLVEMELLWLGSDWLANTWGYSWASLIGGQNLSPIGWVSILRALLQKPIQPAGVHRRRLGIPGFGLSLKCSKLEEPLQTMAARLQIWLWAQLPMKRPYWQIHSS